jgi:hypothetical protein
MRLLIDTRNGIAGDITAAGLIGLGADAVAVTRAMEAAGRTLCPTTVSHTFQDGIHRLSVELEERPSHLTADRARACLAEALEDADISGPWTDMGRAVLEALLEAEAAVHSSHPQLRRHYHGARPVLHEASDIILDITGIAAGMMSLGIVSAGYIDHVNVGSGTVNFSHGALDVPTPATRHLLDSRGIPWKRSDAGMEMATPTGAAILAGCGASRVTVVPEHSLSALAGGTRRLPPIHFMLAEMPR